MLLMNFSIHKECDQNCVINKKHSMKILFCLLYCIFAPGETLDRRKAQNPQNPPRGSQHVGIDCLAEQNQYLFSCCHVSSLCWEPQSSGVLPSSTATCQKVTACLLKTLILLWSPLIHVSQMAFANLLEARLVLPSMWFLKTYA